MKPIPAFSPEQLPEALRACIYTGVATVPGFVSEETVRQLAKITSNTDVSIPAEDHLDKLPELQGLLGQVFPAGVLPPSAKLLLYAADPTANPERASVRSHVDDKPSDEGFSVLMPTSGDRAVFAASTTPFDLYKDLFHDESGVEQHTYPEYVAEYGVGDAMFIRQSIRIVSGHLALLPGMRHCGAGPTDRRLTSLDVSTSSINLLAQASS